MESESQTLSSLLQDTLRDLVNAIHDERLVPHKARSKTATGIWTILDFIRSILQHAWTSNSNDSQEILLILALSSRDQRLRRLFGGCFDQNARPEDSILAYILESILSNHVKAKELKVLESAVRLIANCVADINYNRRLALQKNAIKNLMILLKERQYLAYVIPALYNLCVEYEDPDAGADAKAPGPAKANPAQIELAHSDREGGVIRALFGALSGIPDEHYDRTALLAELIEMVSQTAPEDLLCLGVSSDTDHEIRQQLFYQGLLSFFGPEANALMTRDGDSAVTLCGALINVLAAKEVKQILVSERQMQRLADFNHIICNHIQNLAEAEDEADALTNLKACEKALLQEFYALSGLPEFPQAYTIEPHPSTHPEFTKESGFIQVCIERLRNSKSYVYDPNPSAPSLAIVYTVLANLTTSEETAVKLVSGYRVHEPLQSVLRDVNDVDVLYPALGLLSRLALPEANKQEIVNCGIFDAVRRFLRMSKDDTTIDWKPALRIEAITTLRRLISGQPSILVFLHQDSELGCYFRDILELFAAYKDSSTKIEIGRLFVEHFRTISTTQATITADSKLYERMMITNNLAGPIAFLACEGQSHGAKAEGWFGLGLMTFWERTRPQVLEVMKTPRLVEEVEKVSHTVPSSDIASADNLKLILSRLDIEQGSADVDRHVREVFCDSETETWSG